MAALSDSPSLLRRSAHNLFFEGGGQLISQLMHTGTRLVLARMLTPQDFGVVSMALVFIGFVSLISDLGMGTAIVQRRDLTEQQRSTMFWVTTFTGVLMCALFFLCAPLVGLFFHSTLVVPVVRAMSLGFLLGIPEKVYMPLLRRDMKFKSMSFYNVACTIIAAVASIAAGYWGLGVWALVLYNLIWSLAIAVMLVLSVPWHPRFQFSVAAFSELWSFGSSIVIARIANFFHRNLDNILIGKYLGEKSLGFYTMAYQAINVSKRSVAQPLISVSFPAFSKIQDDIPRCRAAYMATLRATCMISWMVSGLAVFAGPAAVTLILGEKWEPATIPFQILGAVSAIQAMMTLSAPLFSGLGRPELNARWAVISFFSNATGFLVGLRWNITGIAAGYLISTILSAPVHFRMVVRVLDLKPSTLISLVARGLVCFCSLGIAWYGCAYFVGSSGMWKFAICVVVSVAVYLLSTFFLLRKAWALMGKAGRSFLRMEEETA